MLDAGADKVSVNSAALQRPELIDELARGLRRAVRGAGDRRQGAAAASAQDPQGWEAYVAGGRTATGRDVVEWAREAVERGAGEILLTSMDRDGTSDGYDLPLTERRQRSRGRARDRLRRRRRARAPREALRAGADAVLCASIFHYGRFTVAEAKAHLAAAGIPVRER